MRIFSGLAGVLLVVPVLAGPLSIAQYPLFLASATRPNILVVYDNSESMDGTMAGKVIAGDDPNTRGNIARGVITKTINSFAGQFNWGLESFAISGSPALYTTYAYYMGDATSMVFTNDCVGGVSASNGGLRCVINPQPGNGFNYVTYVKTGDDPDINDVLYAGNWGNQLWGIGVPGGTQYDIYGFHNNVPTWSSADFSLSFGRWSFTPTDAGFLPSTPPYPRQLFLLRAWGYGNGITGAGTLNEPIKSSSDAAHFNTLLALLAPETSNASSAEVKNAALFTPLAGSLATARQYFSGGFSGYASPITLACQKSFVLLATDGNPTGDLNGNMYPLSQQQNTYNAGTGTWTFSQAASDVFTYVTALRNVSVSGSTHDIPTYVVGLGDTLANPSSVATLNQIANLGGTGNAYLAKDAASLSNAFQAISVDIASKTASASAVSLNTGSWGTGTELYQARFSSGDWSGQIIAYQVNADGSLGAQLWDAGQVINGQSWDSGRTVLTYKPSTALGARGIPFRWPVDPMAPKASELDVAQSSLLNADMLGVTDGYGAQRIPYLRGSVSNEIGTCGTCTPAFRNRATSKLGDIVHSAPAYVAAPAFGYPDSMEAASYSAFAGANAGRAATIYVGSNDGMLHGFSAATGKEVLAYVPTPVYRNLSALTAPTYVHRYYVDGPPTIGDVVYGGAWHTLLTGALGAGGQGVYALDVTDPTKFQESNASSIVRWEFTDANDPDLGYVFGQPLVVKTNNGRWSVIVPNGYNNTEADGKASSTGHAALFVLDAETGAVTAKLDTGVGSTSTPNGLSGPIAIDVNGDGIADVVYAGDLSGNLWKFDLSAKSATSWAVAFGGLPLFATPGQQPITVRPDVTKFAQGGYLVTFGTGRYVDTGDPATTQPQAFYGIRDNGAAVSGLGQLVQQSVAGTASGTDGNSYRVTTHAVGPATLDHPITGDNAISLPDYNATKSGWYLNLPTSGERVNSEPTIRAGRVVFNTLIPNTDPCSFGGSGWVMEVDVMTGNRYDTPTFDTNGDKDISNVDLVNFGGYSNNTSGRNITSIPAAAGFLRMPVPPGKHAFENKYVNTSAGSVTVVGETAGLNAQGRTSWRQLQ